MSQQMKMTFSVENARYHTGAKLTPKWLAVLRESVDSGKVVGQDCLDGFEVYTGKISGTWVIRITCPISTLTVQELQRIDFNSLELKVNFLSNTYIANCVIGLDGITLNGESGVAWVLRIQVYSLNKYSLEQKDQYRTAILKLVKETKADRLSKELTEELINLGVFSPDILSLPEGVKLADIVSE